VSTTQKSRGHDRNLFKSIIITLLWASKGKKISLQKRLAGDAKVVMFETVSFRSLTPSLFFYFLVTNHVEWQRT
jgi:hypothetical protein